MYNLVEGDLSSLKVTLGAGSSSQQNDYTRLYSCKHFRNRVLRLQALTQELHLDSILLIHGMDAKRDSEMTKLTNWLLFGLSSSDIHGSTPDFHFDDSLLVISKNSVQVYTTHSGLKALNSLVTLVPNCNIFALTKEEEEDSERAEVLKVTKFYEMVHDKQTIGVPVSAPAAGAKRDEKQTIESWPIVQAYGLDIVGNGFFGMKHRVTIIREQLAKIYQELDSFAMFRIVFDQIDRLNRAYYTNFIRFNRATPAERLAFTELKMAEEFQTRHKFSILFNKSAQQETQEDGLPASRMLIGPERTNMDFQTQSDGTKSLFESNQDASGALHCVLEHAEQNSGIRFARTMFLSSLAKDGKYMDGVWFSEDADMQVSSQQGLLRQKNALTLFNCYSALIKAFKSASEQYLCGDVSMNDLLGFASFQALDQAAQAEGRLQKDTVLPNGISKHLEIQVRSYNSYGSCAEQKAALDPRKLITIRFQLKNIMSEAQAGQNLGSVVYAQSFFIIEPRTSICLTKGVPNSLVWTTDNSHYANVPLPINTADAAFKCAQLGNKLEASKELLGLYPVRSEFHSTLSDRILNGKLTWFEHGFVFEDMRLGAFVLPYTALEKITFHGNTHSSKDWMEVCLNQEGVNLVPCGYIAEPRFFLLVNHAFTNETIIRVQKITEELQMVQVKARNQRRKERQEQKQKVSAPSQAVGDAQDETEEERKGDKVSESASAAETAAETAASQSEATVATQQESEQVQEDEDQLPAVKMPLVEKAFEEVTRVIESFAWRNYQKNDAEYKAAYGSEQAHFDWEAPYYEELLEFHAIQEFNELKGKQFVPLQQFSEVYRLVQGKPKATQLENTVVQLTEKLKRNQEEPSSLISVILVAGIPGSGKGRFAYALRKHLGNEKLAAYDFKMPTLEKSLRYDTDLFVDELTSFVEDITQAQSKHVDAIVAAMPSYQHLKKAIMELRKSETFTRRFEIKFVVTKVRAANFFQNPHSNPFQFLIENCMKGIAHAVAFEKGFVEQDKVALMLRTLENANPGGILPMTGRAFPLESLSQILMRQNDRLNMMYTKHFYGFEKEGKSDHFLEKQVSAATFNFRYPLRLSEVQDKLQACIGLALTDIKHLLPKSLEQIKEEEKAAAAEAEKVAKMTPQERRKYELKQKQRARMEADLEPERKMQEGMAWERKLLASASGQPLSDTGETAVFFERIRGIVNSEEDESQDFELIVTADEVSMRALKNQGERIPDSEKVILVYGRNLTEAGLETLKDLLKLCREQQAQRRVLKKREDVTEAEEQSIQEEFFNQFIPDGWYFDGSMYRERNGGLSQFGHPNLELLIQRHLDEVNDEIGAFNRDIRKKIQEEQKQYE